MLNEEQGDQAHELKEAIWDAVHALVDKMTEGVDPEVDDLIRVQLAEDFRFWRTVK